MHCLFLVLLLQTATPAPVGSAQTAVTGAIVDARIRIFKARRELELFSGDLLLRTYAIGLGFDPVSDKRRQGDGATPEGDYFVCVKNPQSRYYLSLGINYPNGADGDRGYENGLVTGSERDAIRQAEAKGRRPSWNTALGGDIFIHGRGSQADWTLGCIALEDPDMKELYEATSVGTRVEILP